MASIDFGDPAPDFTLEGTDGTFTLSDHRGRRVVLLFYPGDDTPVCTRQFCSYRDREEDMADLDAVVVGISAQSVDSHERFRAKHGITVPLLADTSKRVAKLYGVSGPLVGTRRATFVVGPDGHIAFRHVHTLGLDFLTADQLRAALDAVPAT